MEELKIIKIGGNVIDNPAALERFLNDFTKIEGAKILVHGGGVMASQLLKTMGIEPQMVGGRRITDAETLKVVTMVYAGLINKNIVAALQKLGCNSVGLSGADCNAIRANMRPKEPIDYGFVGDIADVNPKSFGMFLENGIVPVVCAINHDGRGTLLNTNADTVASSIAVAMAPFYRTSVIFCFEKNGVLYDKDDDTSIIPEIDKALFAQLKSEGRVVDGMLPKLENAFKAIDNGVKEVIIKHASNLLGNLQTTIK
ncbi:MAG: acetylglutamate kinase [Bacteroidales bacterium]|nr:acetylglutamate kinase [Bacteroidales bacterium]